MAVETLKSTSITSLDTVPVSALTAGMGGAGAVMECGDYVTVSASASTTSTYKLARVPTNAKVKAVVFESEAQGAGKFDLSVYYSSSTVDGTAPAVQGIIVPTTGAAFFASAIDCASLVVPTNVINESTSNTLAKRNQPLWQALGLTSDPGGFFDIVAVCVTTAVTTGTGKMGVRVQYIN